MIEKNKNYTIQDLKNLLGDDWKDKVGFPKPIYIEPKPIINSFDDFDEETKQIYLTILNVVKSKNVNKNVKVWASGSRVKGTWKTKEESESYALINNRNPKYSDYDYCTDSIIIPTTKDFSEVLNVKVDLAGCGDKKVLIEPEL